MTAGEGIPLPPPTLRTWVPGSIQSGSITGAAASVQQAINAQVTELAPVLNSPTVKDGVKATQVG